MKRAMSMSSKTNSGICLIVGVILSTTVTAFAGGDHSGGGNKLKLQFRLRAYEMIDIVSTYPEAVKECSPDLLLKSLEGAKIQVVDKLINPKTKKEITDEKLDAWSVPGLIQLKEPEWSSYFSKVENDEYVDKEVLHEIYRTTGSCNDNEYRISGTIIRDSERKFSQNYLLTKSMDVYEFGGHGRKAICNETEVNGICLIFIKKSYYNPSENNDVYSFEIHLGKIGAVQDKKITLYEILLKIELDQNSKTFNRISSIAKAASEETPFRVIFDKSTGTINYGLVGGKILTLD